MHEKAYVEVEERIISNGTSHSQYPFASGPAKPWVQPTCLYLSNRKTFTIVILLCMEYNDSSFKNVSDEIPRNDSK